MLLLRLDDKGQAPLHRKILDALRERITSGAVKPGAPLPSTRRLADSLGVHRSTVALAYQELWSLGFVDLRPGTRPRVRERTQIVTREARPAAGLVDWRALASGAADEVLQRFRALSAPRKRVRGRPVISFRSLDMDARLFPIASFRRCIRRAMATRGAALLGYGDPAGDRSLREYVAERMVRHGISATADEVLLTNGSQHAIDLVLRMVAARSRPIAIESPTYDLMLPLLRLNGLRPHPIPLRPDGMDLVALERALARERPALVYTMPSFQNPTGVCTSQAHRERLLALCEKHRVPIVEDGFEEEMKYTGREVLPLKSMDRRRIVIYLGTFSKVLFPGVRIGWVVADRGCIERLTAIRRVGELAPGAILQAAVDELCREGSYDRHVGKMHRVFRSRMRTALTALREHVRPEWAQWLEPRGGYLIWLKLMPPCARSADLDALLASHGAEAALGRLFFSEASRERYIRLSISALAEEEIVEGVARLSRALGEAARANLGGRR